VTDRCVTHSPGSGAGAHGDYLFGWKGDSLQKAMDKNCNLNRDCTAAGIHAQSPDVYSSCTKPQQAKEDVDGCKSGPRRPTLYQYDMKRC